LFPNRARVGEGGRGMREKQKPSNAATYSHTPR